MLNSERIGQGRENAKRFLAEQPDIAKAIEHTILKNAGLAGEAPTANQETAAPEAAEVIPEAAEVIEK